MISGGPLLNPELIVVYEDIPITYVLSRITTKSALCFFQGHPGKDGPPGFPGDRGEAVSIFHLLFIFLLLF